MSCLNPFFDYQACLLMSLASKPNFRQILYERSETFPFLKAIFRTVVDKQVIRYAGVVVENMAMDKERVHLFRQHDDLLGLMVEKCTFSIKYDKEGEVLFSARIYEYH
jgi:hypothetical protein